MTGFARVYEKARSTGAGQCGGDFIADMPGFAHAGDDCAPAALQYQVAGALEILVDAVLQGGDGFRLHQYGAAPRL